MPRRYGWSPTTNGRRTHDAFLDEKSTYTDGTVADRRQHLVKVERMVRKRIREKRLFTFLEPPEGCGTTIPATNNLIESWNARIRYMLRHHRGLSLIHHIRAVGRWRRQHTRRPQPASWLVANAITNQRIEELYERAWEKSPQGAHEIYGTPNRWGAGIDWNEFHTSVRHPNATEWDRTLRHTFWLITPLFLFLIFKSRRSSLVQQSLSATGYLSNVCLIAWLITWRRSRSHCASCGQLANCNGRSNPSFNKCST